MIVLLLEEICLCQSYVVLVKVSVQVAVVPPPSLVLCCCLEFFNTFCVLQGIVVQCVCLQKTYRQGLLLKKATSFCGSLLVGFYFPSRQEMQWGKYYCWWDRMPTFKPSHTIIYLKENSPCTQWCINWLRERKKVSAFSCLLALQPFPLSGAKGKKGEVGLKLSGKYNQYQFMHLRNRW